MSMPAQPDLTAPRPVLTWTQRRLLTFLRSYLAENGYPPSMRELADGCDLASTSTVSYQLGQLMAKGYVSRVPGRPRAIRINGTEGSGAA